MQGRKLCDLFVVIQKNASDFFVLLCFGFSGFPPWEIMGRHPLREGTPRLQMTTCKSLSWLLHHRADTNLAGLQPPAFERCREARNAVSAVHSLSIIQRPKHNLHSSMT